jgi:transmembrane sensor
VTLGRGQSVRYSHDGIGSPRAVDPAQAAAWRRGRLIFDDVALSDVVTALNRYRRNRAVILDPTLAARKVSGIFQADQADLALATIARDLGVGTATLPGLVTLLY